VLHDVDLLAASLAVHVNGVVPTGNVDPEPGVHEVVIGAVPPLAVGFAKVTAMGLPVDDDADINGQVIARADDDVVVEISCDSSLRTPAEL